MFRQGSDLLYLDQMSFGDTLFDTSLPVSAYCYEQVVSYQLDLAAQLQSGSSIHPSRLLPDRLRWRLPILVAQHFIVSNHFFCRSAYALASQVVNIFFCIVESTCGNIQSDSLRRLPVCIQPFDGFDDHLDRFFVGGQVRCESAFIANGSVHALALQYALQVMEYLHPFSALL